MSWTSDIFNFSEILVVLIVSKHSYILTLGGAQLSNLGVKRHLRSLTEADKLIFSVCVGQLAIQIKLKCSSLQRNEVIL